VEKFGFDKAAHLNAIRTGSITSRVNGERSGFFLIGLARKLGGNTTRLVYEDQPRSNGLVRKISAPRVLIDATHKIASGGRLHQFRTTVTMIFKIRFHGSPSPDAHMRLIKN
jgi:hypothetical protein